MKFLLIPGSSLLASESVSFNWFTYTKLYPIPFFVPEIDVLNGMKSIFTNPLLVNNTVAVDAFL